MVDINLDTAFVQTLAESSPEKRSRSLVGSYRMGQDTLGADYYAVLLQAMKEEPALEAKCRDKFLVQSVAVTADKEFTNIGAIVRYTRIEVVYSANRIQWQHVDDADRASVQEKKIRVVYLAAEGGAAVTPLKNGINGANGVVSDQCSLGFVASD